jgi:myo-inositol-1(or 4)-monophosphatase
MKNSNEDINRLLIICQDIVQKSLIILKDNSSKNQKFKIDNSNLREMKADIDLEIEKYILNVLKKEDISILSEETGEISNIENNLKFIIDPLDGTVNYVRGLGNCSISLALFKNNKPIFGILGIYPSLDIAWGGKKIGSFINNKKISVSKINKISNSIICSGFPSRFNIEKNIKEMNEYINLIKNFFKVRMVGSASISLLNISKGSAECYAEKNIMLWDVAAGLAILEGAGGYFNLKKTKLKNCYNVFASNNSLYIKGQEYW